MTPGAADVLRQAQDERILGDEPGMCSEIKATHMRRSCEDVFGEFQGKLVFLGIRTHRLFGEWSEI